MAPNGILVTGGTGKTGARLVYRLIEEGRAVNVASRSGAAGSGARGVRFDWSGGDQDDAALDGVGSVYLVAPVGVADVHTPMVRLIDKALQRGVRRFVLLSASSLPEGGPAMGSVHAYLAQRAPEWAVLRPSWFMQNFSAGQHLVTIRDEDSIYSATGEGRVPFIDANDISEVALHALLAPEPHNSAHVLTGPEALSYATAARVIGDARGRAVRHIDLSTSQLAQRWETFGVDAAYVEILAAMDHAIERGAEDRVTDAVERLTGRAPTPLADFARHNAPIWK